MDRSEFAGRIRGGVGKPLSTQPDFNRQVRQWIVHHVKQATLNGHGRFSVGIAGCCEEQNLGWNADVEVHGGRTWQVVFRIVRVAVAHGVNPFSSAPELHRDLVGTGRCVFWEGVSKGVSTGLIVGFHTRNGDTVDEKVHDGRGGLAVFRQHLVEVVEQRAVDDQSITGHQDRRCFADRHLRLSEHDESRRCVGPNDARGARNACVLRMNVRWSNRHVRGHRQVAPCGSVGSGQDRDLHRRSPVEGCGQGNHDALVVKRCTLIVPQQDRELDGCPTLGPVVQGRLSDPVQRGKNEVHDRETPGVKRGVAVGPDVEIDAGDVGGLHHVGARCEGFAQSNGGVPEPIHANSTAGGREAGRLTVDGEQNVCVGEDTVVPLDQA